MNWNRELIDEVKTVFTKAEFGAVVSKPVRYGFTTSAILAAQELGQRLLLVAPTHKILDETVFGTDNTAIKIRGNQECRQLQEEVKLNPLLRHIPALLPNCGNCKYFEDCKISEFQDSDGHFTVVGITYAKLQTIMSSNSERATTIREKLIEDINLVLFDESHILSQPGIASVPIELTRSESVTVPLSDVVAKFTKLQLRYNEEIVQLMADGEETTQQHLSKRLLMPPLLRTTQVTGKPWIDCCETTIQNHWVALKQLAQKGEVSSEVLKTLSNIVTIMNSRYIFVHYITGDNGLKQVSISAGDNSLVGAVTQFCKMTPEAKKVFVSGSQYEPWEGFFEYIAGGQLDRVAMPDTRKAADKLTLIPDTFKLSSWNFKEKLSEMLARIREISKAEGDAPIYCIVGNKSAFTQVKMALNDLPNVDVDYYRSSGSMGVARTERIGIALGLAEVPGGVCDPLTKDFESSRCLRLQGVHAATWQAVNRVRDPAGLEESRVYFIGVRAREVANCSIWGTNRRALISRVEDFVPQNGKKTKLLTFKIGVEQLIDLPHVRADPKLSSQDRRTVSIKDYIYHIQPKPQPRKLMIGWRGDNVATKTTERSNMINVGIPSIIDYRGKADKSIVATMAHKSMQRLREGTRSLSYDDLNLMNVNDLGASIQTEFACDGKAKSYYVPGYVPPGPLTLEDKARLFKACLSRMLTCSQFNSLREDT